MAILTLQTGSSTS